jgi:excisionase family DNA binding protein
MAATLEKDAQELRQALAKSGERLRLSLSRETIELVVQMVDARAKGGEVVFTRGNQEVTPTEAAAMLGISRPQVRKLMNQGLLSYRMVGTHHRIPIEGITRYLESERRRRQEARKKYAAFQNELGLI